MNRTEMYNMRLEQQRQYIFEKIRLKRELLWTVRPCFDLAPRKACSNFELCSKAHVLAGGDWNNVRIEDEDIDFIDASDSLIEHNVDLNKYNIEQPWEDEKENIVEQEDHKINVENIIFETAPEDYVYKCRLRREKRGTFPVFCLYYQHAPKKRTFLLAGKKCMFSKSASYTISTDPENFSRKSPSYVAKLRSNLIGTKYTIYDMGQTDQNFLLEIGGIMYKKNLFGLKGPRKITLILPSVDENGSRTEVPASDLSLFDLYNKKETDGIISFQNKKPVWDNVKRAYVINFEGRVKRASIKNFKFVRTTETSESLLMQFGKVSRDSFSMDFSYPLCALQAFAIALSSIDYKLACE